MNDIWEELYQEKFVKNDLTFLGVDDLYRKIEIVRENYQKLDFSLQRFYKWYFFYQLCIVNYSLKSVLWTYITHKGENYEKLLQNINEEYEKFKIRKENLFKSQI